MVTALYVVFGTFAATALYVVIADFVEEYVRLREIRLVTCPETARPAAVGLAAARASAMKLIGKTPAYRLRSCSRWPERAGCDEACTKQIAAAPDDSAVGAVVSRWYVERSCIACAKPAGEIDFRRDRPMLWAGGEPVIDWHDVAPEIVPDLLTTHMPICRECRIAGSLSPKSANA